MKAQSGSWNVILASVIGVVVLIVLIVLFNTNIINFSSESNACENKGGFCARSCSQENGFYQVQLACNEELPKCCFKGEDFKESSIIVRNN